MNASRKLKDRFRARDDDGDEWKVRIYEEVNGNCQSGSTENFAGGTAVAMSGPFKGMSREVDPEGGDVYRVRLLGGPIRITRIRRPGERGPACP